MSQGGSLGGPPAAFPGSNESPGVTGPEPTPGNPGGVFPKSDPSPASAAGNYSPPDIQRGEPRSEHSPAPPRAEPTVTSVPVPGGAQARGQGEDPRTVLGNPFQTTSILSKLSSTLTEVIDELTRGTEGASPEANAMVSRFSSWRTDVDQLRAGIPFQPNEDDEGFRRGRQGVEEGGLYRD